MKFVENMVYYKSRARSDLKNIIDGLINRQAANGQKHLARADVFAYVRDIRHAFDSIDKLPCHHKAFYNLHKQHEQYMHSYKRNPRTVWYACYDWFVPDAFVNRVLNNYCTVD